MGWRGERVAKLPPPVVLTPICSHLASPLNALNPKSSDTVNSPDDTVWLVMVTWLDTWLPPERASYRAKAKSYCPLAGLAPSLRLPWYVNPLPAATVGESCEVVLLLPVEAAFGAFSGSRDTDCTVSDAALACLSC